jgi:hypothetical protein
MIMRSLTTIAAVFIMVLPKPASPQIVVADTVLYTAPWGSFPAFGWNMSLADSNADGALDLYIVDSQVVPDGRAYVLQGPLFTTAAMASIPSPVFGLGTQFAVHDLDNDGGCDFILGSPQTPVGGLPYAGRVLVSFSPDFQTTLEIQQPPATFVEGDFFGSGIAVGDFDADGQADLLVGADAAVVNGSNGAGCIYVFTKANGYFSNPSATIATPFVSPLRRWGRFLNVADLDGDGHDDLMTQCNLPLIGFGLFPQFDQNAMVQFGPPIVTAGFSLGLQTRIVDLDLDGALDIVASDPGKTGGGQVLIFSGPSFQNPTFLKPPGQSGGAGSGYGLSHGDVDRDGTIDIVVGSPYDNSGNLTKNGRVTIFFGPDFVNTQSVYGQYSQSRFGQGVVVHDFDGDGYGEILVACGGEWGGGSLHLLQHESLSLQTANSVSLSAGGTVKFAIQRGKLAASAPYLMLMSASGSTPGLQIPFAGGSVHLPLNFDAATVFGLQFVNSGVFIAFQGVLDTKGEAVPRFVVPGGVNEPALFGLPLTFAAVLGEAGPYISATTNAKVVTLGP